MLSRGREAGQDTHQSRLSQKGSRWDCLATMMLSSARCRAENARSDAVLANGTRSSLQTRILLRRGVVLSMSATSEAARSD